DGGQSPEEYSLLCHFETAEIARLRAAVELSADRGAARRAVVREIRETHLPLTLRVVPSTPVPVADDLFFSPLVSEITGTNPPILERLRASPHPLLDLGRWEEYEELLASHVGRGYLDLEETAARRSLARSLGDLADGIAVATVSRPEGGPADWFRHGPARSVLESDLAGKETGGSPDGFQSRLIGVFPSVPDPLGGPSYFNSPTTARREHGKVRILPRDRFGILGLAGSERLAFAELRRLIERQSEGVPERLLAVKYPYTAHILVRQILGEAAELAREGTVKVVFVEGFAQTVNPMTGGFIDQLFQSHLPPGVEYHRFVARPEMRAALPNLPGGLLLIEDRLRPLIPGSFLQTIDGGRLFSPHSAFNANPPGTVDEP
ncbi:MAG TPA: hypothetical protein VGH73_15535, partial [Thermoanaerobaculia bacterium]